MALAVARDLSAANTSLTLASAMVRSASREEARPRRPRRLAAPAASVPAQNRILLRGGTVLFR
jgi:hypothetical protein